MKGGGRKEGRRWKEERTERKKKIGQEGRVNGNKGRREGRREREEEC